MLSLRLLTVASALTLFSGVNAGVLKRNEEPPQPSCTDFTPFVYAGCFQDPSSPSRALLYNSGLDTQNMTVEKCVAFCKGNDYRYAGLEYYGQCFCGASVNGPQIAESNCNFPCTGNSSETCGGNDIISIYQDPTFPTVDNTVISDYKPLGCYAEGTSGRSLAWRQDQVSSTSLTIESCLSACKTGGYSIAGVEYGQECYCGVVLGNGTVSQTTGCDIPCTGNSTEICGGRGTLDLFVAMDLESSEPCGETPPSSSTSTSATYSSTTSSTLSTTSSTYSSITSSSTSSGVTSSLSTSSTSSTSSSSYSSSSSSSSTSSSSKTYPPSTSSTTSSTTSSKPTYPPTTSSTTSSKTTPTLCTSTTTISPTPTCEYQCGKWCSKPIPTWGSQPDCFTAHSNCAMQVASCFLYAGFPDSMKCFEFSNWCQSVSNYCQSSCPGPNCSKSSCTKKYPPVPPPSSPNPTISTSVYTCAVTSTNKPSSTTSKPPASSTTSCIPVPTCSNMCTQPHNPYKGYSSNAPVGNIPIPCLTCNNIQSDYNAGYHFKLYNSPDSKNCPSYPSGGSSGPGKGCKDGCDNQYTSCMNTYAEGCKSNKFGDSYQIGSQKCKDQWNDCYSTNAGVNGANKCGSWNSGWY